MMRKGLLSTIIGLSLFVGCQSYDIVQSNIFSDEDGYVVTVEYGRSESPHTNTFRNPVNGKDMSFETRLLVRVHLPDGETFKAWQCMNFNQSGTLYKTDDGEWVLHANGFASIVYKRDGKDDPRPGEYREVYRGVLCETPKSDFAPNEKWRDLKKDTRGNWK